MFLLYKIPRERIIVVKSNVAMKDQYLVIQMLGLTESFPGNILILFQLCVPAVIIGNRFEVVARGTLTWAPGTATMQFTSVAEQIMWATSSGTVD